MRRNMFGDPYIHPDDDLGAIFAEHEWEEGPYTARFLYEAGDEDITPGWCCDIADAEGSDIAHLEGFETKEALIAYAESFGLEVER